MAVLCGIALQTRSSILLLISQGIRLRKLAPYLRLVGVVIARQTHQSGWLGVTGRCASTGVLVSYQQHCTQRKPVGI